jgi:hypothetical protein
MIHFWNRATMYKSVLTDTSASGQGSFLCTKNPENVGCVYQLIDVIGGFGKLYPCRVLPV